MGTWEEAIFRIEKLVKESATTPSRSLAAHKAAYLAGESPVAGIDCLPA
jgi:hypothetical protein